MLDRAPFTLALVLWGCSSPAAEAQLLAPLTGLAPTEAKDDPWADHRPDPVDCNPLTGWYPEDGELEINTGECNYASLTEPSQVAVARGEHVTGTLSYYDLTAAAPAEAHVAIAIGELVLFEKTIAIPSPGDVLEIDVQIDEPIPAGTPVTFHLHNHGQNTWNFSPLEVHDR